MREEAGSLIVASSYPLLSKSAGKCYFTAWTTSIQVLLLGTESSPSELHSKPLWCLHSLQISLQELRKQGGKLSSQSVVTQLSLKSYTSLFPKKRDEAQPFFFFPWGFMHIPAGVKRQQHSSARTPAGMQHKAGAAHQADVKKQEPSHCPHRTSWRQKNRSQQHIINTFSCERSASPHQSYGWSWRWWKTDRKGCMMGEMNCDLRGQHIRKNMTNEPFQLKKGTLM